MKSIFPEFSTSGKALGRTEAFGTLPTWNAFRTFKTLQFPLYLPMNELHQKSTFYRHINQEIDGTIRRKTREL